MAKTLTKGDIIVEDIKVGDIHYEFEFGFCIKSKVILLPSRDSDGYWTWKSKNTNTGKEIQYGVREGMSHYAPNLYSYEAYSGCKYI
jgi:hypothetical protein